MAAVDFLSPPLPRLFAHRGLVGPAVENTLEAFGAAVAAGAKYLETDVRLTADGVAVLFHDETLLRLTGNDRQVSECTFAELQHLITTHGMSFAVCSLSRVLQSFPGAFFNIDVKDAAALATVVADIEAAQAEARVLLASFRDATLSRVRRQFPQFRRSAASLHTLGLVLLLKLGLIAWARQARRGCVALQIPTRILGMRTTSVRFLRRAHASGLEVHFWTINDVAEALDLRHRGADGLVTDDFVALAAAL